MIRRTTASNATARSAPRFMRVVYEVTKPFFSMFIPVKMIEITFRFRTVVDLAVVEKDGCQNIDYGHA